MKKGFTLLELIIVVIVIGILVAIALPKFITITEKARRAEGFAMLGELRASQMRYYASQSTPGYAINCGNLDVTLTTPQNFDTLTDCSDSPLARVYRKPRNTAYDLAIGEAGNVICRNGTGSPSCADADCTNGSTCR